MAKKKISKKKVIEHRKYNRIKDVLQERGIKQVWLSGQLDIDYITITRYCNNTRQPSIKRLFEIATILNINPKDLLNS